MAFFYDTHAHLDYSDFSSELEQVVQRANDNGIYRIVTIGTDFASSERAIAISERFPEVFAAVGWHPTNADDAPEDLRPKLLKLANHPKVVAIGETGLDYYRMPSQQTGASEAEDLRYKAKQSQVFQQQLEVAAELGLNCVIHQRSSFEDTLSHMKPFAGRVSGVFHCFVDDSERMRRVLSAGSMVSFTGIITFKNAQVIRDTAAAVPAGKFMLETDCPYLAPTPYRGKRGEPAYVKYVAETVAQIRNCSLQDLSDMTCGTAREFFPKLF